MVNNHPDFPLQPKLAKLGKRQSDGPMAPTARVTYTAILVSRDSFSGSTSGVCLATCADCRATDSSRVSAVGDRTVITLVLWIALCTEQQQEDAVPSPPARRPPAPPGRCRS